MHALHDMVRKKADLTFVEELEQSWLSAASGDGTAIGRSQFRYVQCTMRSRLVVELGSWASAGRKSSSDYDGRFLEGKKPHNSRAQKQSHIVCRVPQSARSRKLFGGSRVGFENARHP